MAGEKKEGGKEVGRDGERNGKRSCGKVGNRLNRNSPWGKSFIFM